MSDSTPATTAAAPSAAPAPAPAAGSSAVPAPTDSDNKYKAVQHKLKALAKVMDDATGRLEILKQRMQANGTRSQRLAEDIAHAELDVVFVELTNSVSTALGAAAVQVSKLHATAQEVTGLAQETQVRHFKFYEALDTVRSGRRLRTPKPGFFDD